MGATGLAASSISAVSAHVTDENADELGELRQATAKYHDLNKAKADGYILPQDHCISHPTRDAAMGYHYGNFALVDDSVDHTEPEVLVYEQRGKKRHLVAVEFLSTADPDGDPPSLFGHHFHPFPEPQANWALHAWVWKNNPDGMFADFNPNVSCQ